MYWLILKTISHPPIGHRAFLLYIQFHSASILEIVQIFGLHQAVTFFNVVPSSEETSFNHLIWPVFQSFSIIMMSHYTQIRCYKLTTCQLHVPFSTTLWHKNTTNLIDVDCRPGWKMQDGRRRPVTKMQDG